MVKVIRKLMHGDIEVMYLILGRKMPKGEDKKRLIRFHNSLVGTHDRFRKMENENTFCGSCVASVRERLWKWYHSLELQPLTDLYFNGGFYNEDGRPKYERKES